MNEKYKYDDVFVFLPQLMEIVKIAEGTGDNLLREDKEQGYVDYINYEIASMKEDFVEADGGMILLKQLFREKYTCTEECVEDVLRFHYGEVPGYVILDERLLKLRENKRKWRG
ncbi:MAG: hypothetical protein LUE14_04030 [Clostridiales bacterium]|nr:hypothetical protein [Clostridiales bacterium]